MKKRNIFWFTISLISILAITLVSVLPASAAAVAPKVNSTIPANGATGVDIRSIVTATFSMAVNPPTVNTNTFTLTKLGLLGLIGNKAVAGTVTYAGFTATFSPAVGLASRTKYTAKITTGVTAYSWSFTTGVAAIAQAPVPLGTAANFAILAKSGISTTGTTSISGDIGVSPIAATAITGFGLIMDTSNQFSRSSLVIGKIYAADYAVPTPAKMTTAISDMQTAYTNAAGRTLPIATELGAGNIGGKTIAPGLYKWGTGVIIPTDVTLSGGANDVWIFQIAQTLTVSSGARVNLSGGAQANNIFWQVAGQTTLGTTSVFNGNILCKTAIVLNADAKLNGRALAQTAVTLINGLIGTTGATGATGNTGAAGAQGSTGATGNTGAAGAQGSTGATGDSGAIGTAGAAGLQGGTGATGITGATGTTGANGTAGATGIQGNIGVTGIQGTTGANGTAGAAGIQGITGATGIQGNIGATGTTGANGTAGAAGIQGNIGATGIQGTTGATGTTGANGTAGATGIQGNIGATGTTGANGTAGAAGIQGNIGATGIQGTTGATGITGANGTAGATGIQGITGATGIQGNIGATGTAGAAGPAGAIGPRGVMDYSDFYALMPPDNAATIPVGSPVLFPQNGATNNVITRDGGNSASSFMLPAIGTYQVMFQVSVNEPGQLVLGLDSGGGVVEQAYSAVGRATGTSQIAGMSLVTTTAVNSKLTVRNPSGNAAALTITPIAGGTHAVSAHIIIMRIQ